jgi:hypothetical protein
MPQKVKTLGFIAVAKNGFSVGAFHARNASDVRRALEIEWMNEADQFEIKRVPANTVSSENDGGFTDVRYYNLMNNEGWDALIAPV